MKPTSNKIIKILLCILFVLLWSVLCFFVWIRSVFYGNWFWSEKELIANDPVNGRIAVFLANYMTVIWIIVPVVIAVIIYLVKRKKKK